MNNKGLLVLILVIALGIFTISIMEYSEDTPVENMSESVNQFTEDLSN